MSYGTSQVVGLIELDRPTAEPCDHPLSPPVASRRAAAASDLAQVVNASDDDDLITADLRQLKRELRAELAYVVARLNKSLRREAGH